MSAREHKSVAKSQNENLRPISSGSRYYVNRGWKLVNRPAPPLQSLAPGLHETSLALAVVAGWLPRPLTCTGTPAAQLVPPAPPCVGPFASRERRSSASLRGSPPAWPCSLRALLPRPVEIIRMSRFQSRRDKGAAVARRGQA